MKSESLLITVVVAAVAFFAGFYVGKEHEKNQNTVRIQGEDWRWQIDLPGKDK